MPIHLEHLDVANEVAGLSPALIVPCYMCPAVTVAVKERKPFIQFFRKFLNLDIKGSSVCKRSVSMPAFLSSSR